MWYLPQGILLQEQFNHTHENSYRQKPFPCDTCDRAFIQSTDLVLHKRIHTGEKPFSCDSCEKAFRTSCQLTIHNRIHTGQKPFPCDICDKAFIKSSDLVRHKRIHTGENPFICDSCEKAFRTNYDLTVHKRILTLVTYAKNHITPNHTCHNMINQLDISRWQNQPRIQSTLCFYQFCWLWWN